METFLPGKTSEPRCRTSTEPTRAKSPGVTLIPRYFGLESRPFFDEPPAFFVAILFYPEFIEGYNSSRMSITETVTFDKEGRVERFPWFRKLFLSIIIILVTVLSLGI